MLSRTQSTRALYPPPGRGLGDGGKASRIGERKVEEEEKREEQEGRFDDSGQK